MQMKMMGFHKSFYKASFSLFLLMVICLGAPPINFAQTEKLGIVQYTPPKGWKKTTNENVVAFSEYNQSTGIFCILTLYGATTSTGNIERDFKREWNNRVVIPLEAEANPQTATESSDGLQATAGGAAIEFQGSKAFAFLTVISNGRTSVSILGVFNDEAYTARLAAFSSSIELTKAVAEIPAPRREEPVPQQPSSPAAAMHVAALVKEFENNEVRANQVWVGKRVRVYGTVNTIEVEENGQIVMTFKTSITTYKMAKCFFNKSQSSRISSLSAHTEATIEGTVRGFGGGFGNSKAFLLLENCIVP
jgi:hypothetical protein